MLIAGGNFSSRAVQSNLVVLYLDGMPPRQLGQKPSRALLSLAYLFWLHYLSNKELSSFRERITELGELSPEARRQTPPLIASISGTRIR